MFPVDNVSVITGADGKHDPISGIHPHAIDEMRNKLLNENMGAIYADKLKKNNDPDDNKSTR